MPSINAAGEVKNGLCIRTCPNEAGKTLNRLFEALDIARIVDPPTLDDDADDGNALTIILAIHHIPQCSLSISHLVVPSGVAGLILE